MIETIQKVCELLAEASPSASAAAQRLGMHLVDEGMSISFTPRDRDFSAGSAVRRWQTDKLSGIDLDVAARAKLRLSTMRDAFGPFKPLPREHPGDDYEFLAYHAAGAAKTECRISITVQPRRGQPTGAEPVMRVSIAR
jgi:hypothetical protein